uniref:Integrase core domain-containing protein n=1 Tax=Sparus aurata TaxID=8175 RepID=A0A671TXF1_SPAAU
SLGLHVETVDRELEELLAQTMLERFHTGLQHIVSQQPLDLDYLDFVCSQEAVIFSAVSDQVLILKAIVDVPIVFVQVHHGSAGRPKFDISPDSLLHLTNEGLPVPCIANLMGVSTCSIFRRMREFGFSVRALYSTCSNAELDYLVTEIKDRTRPHAGYCLVKGSLQARGFRRIQSAVGDGAGLHAACGHQSQANTVFFTTNNKCTNCLFFRVRANHGVENVDIARLIFIAGKSMHSQRIERLWRDAWCALTSIYYSVLHSLEENGLLDLSIIADLFSCHYAFLPRLQGSLDIFSSGWDNLGYLTPNQLWEVGNIQHAMAEPENAEVKGNVCAIFIDTYSTNNRN